ncbi:MAG: hypothetical protein UHL70_00280 [Acutalibacteraceae bacterium]|nr:hypothetical protein [Acutalibacteraceae bacterium]
MKKSLIIISSLLLVFSVALTACGSKNTIVDKDGKTYTYVTDKDGNKLQDKWGHLIIENTDADGNKVTQIYEFPDKITNKRNTKIENAVVSVNVPDGWEVSEETSFVRLRHKGKCTKSGVAGCQLDFGYQQNLSLQETYNEYLTNVVKLSSLGDSISDIKEYEVTLMGKNAKAISYRVASENTDVYYFCIDDGEPMIEITASVYDKCYDKDSIVELISSCATVKELPTDTVSTHPTDPFTKLSEKTTTTNNE